MIKRLIFLICLIISFNSYAQTDNNNQKVIVRGNPQNQPRPPVVLVIDTTLIKLDSSLVAKLEISWIKKIEVCKDKKYIELYGNTDGLIEIYIKRKYVKLAIKTLGIEN